MVEVLKSYLSKYIPLSSEEAEMLTEMTVVRNYDKKVMLVGEGEVEEYFNFIVKGLARKYFVKGEEEIITQIAKEGEVICSSVSFFTGNPSAYFVETIEPTMFVSISRENLEKLYKADLKWQRIGRLVITELFLQKEYWELERIRFSIQERFVRFLTNNPDLFQRVPQKYLASYLHIQPETFSRLKHYIKNTPAS